MPHEFCLFDKMIDFKKKSSNVTWYIIKKKPGRKDNFRINVWLL